MTKAEWERRREGQAVEGAQGPLPPPKLAARASDLKQKVVDFVKQALTVKDRAITLDLGEIPEEQRRRVKAETGIDYTGYRRVWDNYGIIHAYNSHSDPKKESARGQIPIRPEHFALALDVVENPESIELIEGRNKNNNQVIEYSKTLPDGTVVYAEEVRTGKGRNKRATIVSLRIKRPRTYDAHADGMSPQFNVQDDSEHAEPAGISGERGDSQTSHESHQPIAGPNDTIAPDSDPDKPKPRHSTYSELPAEAAPKGMAVAAGRDLDPSGMRFSRAPLRETKVPTPQEVFDWLGVKPGNVFADYSHLQTKHPELFSTPEEVRDLVEAVLDDPHIAMPATERRYTLLVRRNGANKAAVVEFELRGGKYRVRSAHILTDEQIDAKIRKLQEEGLGSVDFSKLALY